MGKAGEESVRVRNRGTRMRKVHPAQTATVMNRVPVLLVCSVLRRASSGLCLSRDRRESRTETRTIRAVTPAASRQAKGTAELSGAVP